MAQDVSPGFLAGVEDGAREEANGGDRRPTLREARKREGLLRLKGHLHVLTLSNPLEPRSHVR